MQVNAVSNQNFQGRCKVNDKVIRKIIVSTFPKEHAKIYFSEIKSLAKQIRRNSPLFDSYELGFSRPLKHKDGANYFYNIFLRRNNYHYATKGPVPLMPAEKGGKFDYDKASEMLKETVRNLSIKFENINNLVKNGPM